MYYPVLTLLLICLSCQFLYCQNHHYRQYTIDDGLPTNYVYGVREDDRGYIWAYTENGLAKFDGERFHIFTTADGLPSNDVYHFEKDDSTGLLWIMTTANVPAYLEGDSIVPLWEYADKGRGQIHKINGKIRNRDYFVEGKGFNLTDSVFTEKKIGDRIFINYNSQDSVSFGYIQNERRSKFIGSFKYNLPKDQYQIYDWPAAVSSSFNSNNLFTFSNVNPFFVLDSGYYLYSFQPETNERLVFDLNAVTGQKVKGLSVEFPAHNTIQFNTDQFCAFFDNQLRLKEIFYPTNIANQYTLQHFFIDSQSNYWIGSRDGGLFFINQAEQKTVHLQPQNSRDKVMEKLFWHNDTIYAISDNSNIYQLTPQGQLQLVFQHPYQAHFNDLLIRSNGDIILGSSGPPNRNIFINGINHQGIRAKDYPPLQAMLKTPIMTTSDVTFSNIRQLNWNEKQHDFFYSTNRGLFWYDSQDTKLEQIGVARYDWRIYPDTFSHRTYLTRQDSIYSFYDDKLQVERTLPVLVTALWAKDERYLWLGTQNNGLWEWDRRVDSMQQISTRKYINAIYQDGERHLLATQEGVAVLEAINGTYKETYCYNRKDGLLTAEVLDVLADSQFIYAATIQGIMKIEKNAAPFRIDDTLQRLKIRAIHVNDSIRSHSDIEQLKHKENQFLIQYHLLDFPSKGNIQYQYQLQPIQDKWTTTDAKEVRFTKLPPNDYTFLLKATDWYGNEYKLKTPLTFCIQKAYWQTWWFRGLLLSLFLGATAIAIKWREQQQMKKIAHEKSLNQRIAELQLQSLRAQMNPHFIFNALGSIQYFIQTHRTDEADNYLTMFARLMRKYLDSATERMIDLATEIAMLEEYTQLEMMRFEGMFTTHIHLAENIDAESEIIPAMLLQPFVENAINHGLQPRKAEGGQLIIKFTKDAVGILVCTISDNGIGRENAAQHHKKNHTSRGMKNIYSRIETLRANKLGNIELKIQDLDEQQQAYPGTQVKITFNQTHYDDL